MDDEEQLRRHATDVQAWFALHPDGPADARSLELSPGVVPHEEIGRSWKESGTSRGAMDAMLDTVAARRRALLPGAGVRAAPPAGRWAVYDPDLTDFCQLAVDDTDGLFDNADCPGWDLWVACVGEARNNACWSRALVVWVPERFIERFGHGLELMPMSPAVWADDPLAAECPAVGLLRQAGLVQPPGHTRGG